MRKVKIKEIKDIVSYNKQHYLYALGEDGVIYFIIHDPKTNETSWQAVPSQAKRMIG
jgi:hypothetical protein